MSKVFVYLRVSTDKQDTDNQRSGVELFCKHRGITVDEWVADTVSGGKSIKDRKLGGIINRMKRGDSLIISEISRMSRSLMDLMGLLKVCLEQGIKIYAVKEGYELGDNINSKVLAFAFGLAAEIERTLLSARIKEALARKKAAGQKLGRRVGSKNATHPLDGKEELLLKLAAGGHRQNAVARKLKVHRHTVASYCQANGITLTGAKKKSDTKTT